MGAEVSHAGVEGFERVAAEVFDGADPELVEGALGAWSDSPERVDGEGVEGLLDAVWVDDGEAVGFVHVGGELGEELVWGDSD